MADFVVRVELRGNPTEVTYEKLHTMMSQRGFYMTVSEGSRSYAMPHATYYGSSNQAADQISGELRDAIASSVWTKPLVFVSQSLTWALSWK
jgi:hypothetical protein